MLVRFGARDYDTEPGKKTAKDPLLFTGGQPNVDVYLGNNPANWWDPSSLENYMPGGWTIVSALLNAARFFAAEFGIAWLATPLRLQ